MPKPKIVKVENRVLYDVVSSTNELVGSHEDRDVAIDECERLDGEALAHFRAALPATPGLEATTHQVVVREVYATDDPDDGAPNIEGPIVSDGHVTMANLERGEKSEEPVQRIG